MHWNDAATPGALARRASEWLERETPGNPGPALVADGRLEPGVSLLVVGKAPATAELAAGRLFAGPSGALLDRIVRAAGAPGLNEVACTNASFFGCPAGRNPRAAVREACRPVLERLIELLAPRVTVLLGALPTKTLLARPLGFTPVNELREHRTLTLACRTGPPGPS